MVLNFGDLVPGWQFVVKVAFPPCRVVALPVAAKRGPIEDRFDATAQAACRFGLRVPKLRFVVANFLLEHCKHQPGINRGN